MKILFILFLLCFSASSRGEFLNPLLALWHTGSDQCVWATEPNLAQSTWILDRGDGKPVANLVILSFVNPLALLHKANDTLTTNGFPNGMTSKVIKYFQDKGITVMASIGGAGYAALWDFALTSDADATTLAKNTAAIAKQFNIGIEIDYEDDSGIAVMPRLDTFVKVYRSIIPIENSANPSPPSLLTVDLGAGTGYLQIVSKYASIWLANKQVNWVYAMVGATPWRSISEATPYWQQHLDGDKPNNIDPVSPSQLAVSVYAQTNVNCNSYSGTVMEGAVGWINSKHTRGLAFWSVGCLSGCVQNCTGIATASRNLLK